MTANNNGFGLYSALIGLAVASTGSLWVGEQMIRTAQQNQLLRQKMDFQSRTNLLERLLSNADACLANINDGNSITLDTSQPTLAYDMPHVYYSDSDARSGDTGLALHSAYDSSASGLVYLTPKLRPMLRPDGTIATRALASGEEELEMNFEVTASSGVVNRNVPQKILRHDIPVTLRRDAANQIVGCVTQSGTGGGGAITPSALVCAFDDQCADFAPADCLAENSAGTVTVLRNGSAPDIGRVEAGVVPRPRNTTGRVVWYGGGGLSDPAVIRGTGIPTLFQDSTGTINVQDAETGWYFREYHYDTAGMARFARAIQSYTLRECTGGAAGYRAVTTATRTGP